MELNHPADATCLFCHTSRTQPRAPGTINRFSGAPFLQDGVGCERCHGPGGEHAARRGPIVNPAKLTGARRDDVCMQCHLEGVGRITVAGHREADYRPGDTLSDYLAIFVRQDARQRSAGRGQPVRSAGIERAAGGRAGGALTCTSCHDPHVQVSQPERTEYYRAKCLTCHATLADTHHPEARDCTSCHMPRLSSADISHTMVTDHRILRNPRPQATATRPVTRIVQFNNPSPAARDIGLAVRRSRSWRQCTPPRPKHFDSCSRRCRPDRTTRMCSCGLRTCNRCVATCTRRNGCTAGRSRAIQIGAVAAANLGVLKAVHGQLAAALDLWRPAFDKNPYLTALGIDLARGLCDSGNGNEARRVAERALRHNPDSAATRQLVSELATNGCVKR